MRSIRSLTGALAAAVSLIAHAQPWSSQGPAPITGGQVEGMSAQGNPADGAVRST